MHVYGMGFAWVAAFFFWVLGAAALFGIIYFAVRLAALHALKAHTRWLNAGQPTGAAPPPAAYPGAAPPAGAYPAAAPPAQPAPQSPPAQPAPPESPDSPTTPLP